MSLKHSAVAIIPCSDLDETQGFYERLGFTATSVYDDQGYRILHDCDGASVHLTRALPGWVVPDRNAHGLYLYSERVEALATEFDCKVEAKPWGLHEFSISDPDGTLVRVGWPA